MTFKDTRGAMYSLNKRRVCCTPANGSKSGKNGV